MDRNTITGLVLIFVIMIGTLFFINKNSPTTEKKKTVASEQVKDTAATVTPVEAEKDSSEEKQAVTLPKGWDSLATGTDKEFSLQNDYLIMKVATKGGKVSYIELKKYKTFDGKPVVLQKENFSKFGYQFFVDGYDINTEDLYFNAKNITDSSLLLVANLPNGKSLEQYYSLPKESYMVNNRFSMVGLNEVIPKKNQFIDLHWENKIVQNEKDSHIVYNNTTIYYRNTDDKPSSLSETKEDKEQSTQEMQWVSFKQQFFCQTLISTGTPFSNGEMKIENANSKDYVKKLTADLSLPYGHQPRQDYNMQFYYGPLKYSILKESGIELEKQIPLGWGIFGWVNRFIIIPVFNILNTYIANYGIIILILTVIIKLIVLPLTYRSYLTSAKMRLLKPDLEEIKGKANGDMAKQQSEQMKLYRRAGVSPFGGCLPLLLQFPILIAMYRFFPSSIELRQESFLWTHDLSTYDTIANLPFSIPVYGSHVSLWTLLMTISTLIYTKMNNSLSPQNNEFKWMSYIMPIFFLGFFNNYAAGLSMYYFFFNIMTFGQQYIFKMLIDDKKLKAQIEENKKKTPASGVKKSGFQARLEEMAKRQKQIQTQGKPGKGRK
jgi:YidC/Oxa1 family membrane protein insertase